MQISLLVSSHSNEQRLPLSVEPSRKVEEDALTDQHLVLLVYVGIIALLGTKHTNALILFRSKKLIQQSQVAVSDGAHDGTRLFLFEKFSHMRFLVDTGADISVLPPTISSVFNLVAANNTIIKTYGTRKITLSLRLRREFPWTFIIAEVSKAIIGSDFLAHYVLLVDLTGRELIDRLTCIRSKGKAIIDPTPTVSAVNLDKRFQELIFSYSDLLDESAFLQSMGWFITLNQKVNQFSLDSENYLHPILNKPKMNSTQ